MCIRDSRSMGTARPSPNTFAGSASRTFFNPSSMLSPALGFLLHNRFIRVRGELLSRRQKIHVVQKILRFQLVKKQREKEEFLVSYM